ncbi:MAG: hypothetical protein K2N41_03645, partial [Lachnospiraceae bacterium]|nr:hypothetical protein [Lachnospiraceae bacterium]
FQAYAGIPLLVGSGGLVDVYNPKKYHRLILCALDEYRSDKPASWDETCAYDYAAYMLDRIKNEPFLGEKAKGQ